MNKINLYNPLMYIGLFVFFALLLANILGLLGVPAIVGGTVVVLAVFLGTIIVNVQMKKK